EFRTLQARAFQHSLQQGDHCGTGKPFPPASPLVRPRADPSRLTVDRGAVRINGFAIRSATSLIPCGECPSKLSKSVPVAVLGTTATANPWRISLGGSLFPW